MRKRAGQLCRGVPRATRSLHVLLSATVEWTHGNSCSTSQKKKSTIRSTQTLLLRQPSGPQVCRFPKFRQRRPARKAARCIRPDHRGGVEGRWIWLARGAQAVEQVGQVLDTTLTEERADELPWDTNLPRSPILRRDIISGVKL